MGGRGPPCHRPGSPSGGPTCACSSESSSRSPRRARGAASWCRRRPDRCARCAAGTSTTRIRDPGERRDGRRERRRTGRGRAGGPMGEAPPTLRPCPPPPLPGGCGQETRPRPSARARVDVRARARPDARRRRPAGGVGRARPQGRAPDRPAFARGARDGAPRRRRRRVVPGRPARRFAAGVGRGPRCRRAARGARPGAPGGTRPRPCAGSRSRRGSSATARAARCTTARAGERPRGRAGGPLGARGRLNWGRGRWTPLRRAACRPRRPAVPRATRSPAGSGTRRPRARSCSCARSAARTGERGFGVARADAAAGRHVRARGARPGAADRGGDAVRAVLSRGVGRRGGAGHARRGPPRPGRTSTTGPAGSTACSPTGTRGASTSSSATRCSRAAAGSPDACTATARGARTMTIDVGCRESWRLPPRRPRRARVGRGVAVAPHRAPRGRPRRDVGPVRPPAPGAAAARGRGADDRLALRDRRARRTRSGLAETAARTPLLHEESALVWGRA